MINHRNYGFTLAACLVLVGGGFLAGCAKPDEAEVPSLELTVKSVEATSAVFNLHTTNISEYAWSVYAEEPESTPTADVLFMSGTTGTCVNGDNEFTVSGLEGLTNYTLYLAAKTSAGDFYERVESMPFATVDYSADLTVVETDYRSFKINVQVPEGMTVDGPTALRYLPVNLFTYNSNKNGFFGPNPDAAMMQQNGGAEFYIQESQTLTFDNSEEQLYLHNAFAPGEPVVFMVGEYEWGENYGNEGYLIPLFDMDGYSMDAMMDPTIDETPYWSGHYAKTVVQLRKPELLEPTVNVEMDINAVDGTLTFTPEDGVLQYVVFILDEATYQNMMGFLDNNEDYLQWYSTSQDAFWNGAQSFQGPQVLHLSNFFYTVYEQSHYHMLVTAMGDENGTTQNFQHLEFDTTAKTLEAPEVTVTAVGGEVSDNPFEVSFNIKNTGNVPVVSAMYAANYLNEWAGVLAYSSYADVVATGNAFSAADIEQINSAEGLTVTFNTIDGMTTRLAVLAYNEEQTANVIEEGGPAVAEQRAPYQPADERVESPLFTELPGDWTMSANVSVYNYSTGGYADDSQSIKVSIYDGLHDYPETLPSDVYALYPDMSTAEVDQLYEEFKMEAEAYNAKVRGQNWLLCLGFGYESSAYYFTAATPYELFCNPNYSGYDVVSLFYDFGPKWYLEVAQDGSVSVPINSSLMFPMTAWRSGTLYMTGTDSSNHAVLEGAFSAEVSADNATITVNPMTDEEGVMYYPNAMIDYGVYQSLVGNRVVSAPVLTKGWSGETSPASASAVSAPEVRLNSVNFVPGAKPKSRTAFLDEADMVKYNHVYGVEALTYDKFQAYLENGRQQNN